MKLKQAVNTLIAGALLASTFTSTQILAEDDTQATTQPATTAIETGYIRDDLFVFIHVGASKKFKILGSINAGSPVEVLSKNDETGFIEIKDQRGRIGWVETSNFTTEPSANIKLAELTQQIEQQNQQQLQNEATISQLRQQLNQSQNQLEQHKQDLAKAQEKRDTLASQLNQTKQTEKNQERLYGAGIVLGGMFIGFLLTVLWPKKRRRDGWA